MTVRRLERYLKPAEGRSPPDQKSNRNLSGPVRINGDWGDGDVLGTNPPTYLDRNAFLSPAAFTYGNTRRCRSSSAARGSSSVHIAVVADRSRKSAV
jgi:hypothetical protein